MQQHLCNRLPNRFQLGQLDLVAGDGRVTASGAGERSYGMFVSSNGAVWAGAGCSGSLVGVEG